MSSRDFCMIEEVFRTTIFFIGIIIISLMIYNFGLGSWTPEPLWQRHWRRYHFCEKNWTKKNNTRYIEYILSWTRSYNIIVDNRPLEYHLAVLACRPVTLWQCDDCFYNWRLLKQVWRLLGPDITAKLVSAFVHNRLDYCNFARPAYRTRRSLLCRKAKLQQRD